MLPNQGQQSSSVGPSSHPSLADLIVKSVISKYVSWAGLMFLVFPILDSGMI